MTVMILTTPTQGRVMASRVFDTYSPKADVGLASFIDTVSIGRIFCFAVLVSTCMRYERERECVCALCRMRHHFISLKSAIMLSLLLAVISSVSYQ